MVLYDPPIEGLFNDENRKKILSDHTTKKHTPGPWTLSTNPIELRNTDDAATIWKDIKHENEIGSALICSISRSTGDNEATLNAKLIAAAPELLDALEKLHSACWDNGLSARVSIELRKAKEAIKKATE